MSGQTLNLERTFDADAERVFDAWTSEEVMRRWFYGNPGWENTFAEVDLRVGGRVRIVMRNPETGDEYGGEGEYTVVERPTRLAFTWVWDDEQRPTSIEIEFEENDGATTVRFAHQGLVDEESVRSHEGGWNTCLDNIARVLST